MHKFDYSFFYCFLILFSKIIFGSLFMNISMVIMHTGYSELQQNLAICC